MADKWLDQHIEIELNKQKSTIDKILEAGYIKADTNLRHFDVYEKGTKRLLYRLSDKTIDMIYDAKKVFGGIESSSFSDIDFELGEEK